MIKQLSYDAEKQIWFASVCGELDAYHAPKFMDAIQKAFSEHAASFDLDCQHLEYIDSMGLGAMVKALKAVQEQGKTIYLKKVNANVMKLFRITGLDHLFQIEEKEK